MGALHPVTVDASYNGVSLQGYGCSCPLTCPNRAWRQWLWQTELARKQAQRRHYTSGGEEDGQDLFWKGGGGGTPPGA